jgi:carboxypeptidase Taq
MDNRFFSDVIAETKSIKTLESILALLTWDQETLMPPGANAHRTDQKTLLASLIHRKKTAADYVKNIEALRHSYGDTTDDNSIIITRLHHDITQANKLPLSFVEKFTRATSEAFLVWQKAKRINSWPMFKPHLSHIVDLMKEKAHYLGYQKHPLDALLDLYQPGTTVEEISQLFRALQNKLVPLLKKIKHSPLYCQKSILIDAPPSEQLHLCKTLVAFTGFTWERGRMDTSEHPFSTAFHPTDSRITIRTHSDNLLDQLSSALHETGHAMYELGLNQETYGTALSETISLSIHESQSRFWETIIGQSKPFSHHLYRLIEENYSGHNPFSSSEELYNQLNNVVPSLIRTQADEVTYPLHVILRFSIERELLEGSLNVSDIPERWNQGMQENLGIEVPTDAEGCLQDVHWSMGSFGYFPTYTLGSLYAICIGMALKAKIPHLDSLILEGNFTPIHQFLSDHVWKIGRRMHSKELIHSILGREPSEDDYISYLSEKYLPS